MRTTKYLLALALSAFSAQAAAAEPHRSAGFLPSSNGRTTVAFDVAQGRLTQFLEHPYRFPQANAQTRNLLYDAYPGVRVDGVGTWLTSVAPSTIEYVQGTGIVHVVPRRLGRHASTSTTSRPWASATRRALHGGQASRGRAAAGAVDVYALFNYHLGSGAPARGRRRGHRVERHARRVLRVGAERRRLRATARRRLDAPRRRRPTTPTTRSSPGRTSPTTPARGGATTDAVLRASSCRSATSPSNAPGWAGWYSVLDRRRRRAGRGRSRRALDRVRARRRSSSRTRSPRWQRLAHAGAAAARRALETALYAQSQAMLRMAQVARGRRERRADPRQHRARQVEHHVGARHGVRDRRARAQRARRRGQARARVPDGRDRRRVPDVRRLAVPDLGRALLRRRHRGERHRTPTGRTSSSTASASSSGRSRST